MAINSLRRKNYDENSPYSTRDCISPFIKNCINETKIGRCLVTARPKHL